VRRPQLIPAVCLLTLCNCSPPPNQAGWAISVGGGGRVEVHDVALNPAGDVHVSGIAGEFDEWWGEVFVSKVSSTGQLRWSTHLGGTNSHESRFAVTADGAVYVAIEHEGKYYGRKTTIAKLSPEGDVRWTKQFKSQEQLVLRGLATNRTGQLFVVGMFKNTTTFGSLTRTSMSELGASDLFVAKLNSKGETIQVVTATGFYWVSSIGLAPGRGGEVYVTGSCSGESRFGADAWTGEHSAAFVTRIEASGKFGWTRFFGSSNWAGGEAVAVDDAGDLFVAGGYADNISIGGTTISSTPLVETFLQEDAFWLNLTAGGELKAFGVGGGQRRESISGVALGARGLRFVAGAFDVRTQFGAMSRMSNGAYDVLVVGVDRNGKVQGVASGGGPGSDWASAIATDGRGGCYVGGVFEDTAEFGTTSLTAPGLLGGFVWKFGCDGVLSR
jgi:hypothetical protein